jgi:hypothetical protein
MPWVRQIAPLDMSKLVPNESGGEGRVLTPSTQEPQAHLALKGVAENAFRLGLFQLRGKSLEVAP